MFMGSHGIELILFVILQFLQQFVINSDRACFRRHDTGGITFSLIGYNEDC
jgi:hypothetical protein